MRITVCGFEWDADDSPVAHVRVKCSIHWGITWYESPVVEYTGQSGSWRNPDGLSAGMKLSLRLKEIWDKRMWKRESATRRSFCGCQK